MRDYEVFRRWLGDVMDVIYGPSHNWPFKALEKEMMKKPKKRILTKLFLQEESIN